MAKPKTKAELLQAAENNYDKMWQLIHQMSDEQQCAPFTFNMDIPGKDPNRKKMSNLRDILTHLYEWHQLFIDWVETNNEKEESKPFLPEPYNWRTYPQMNIAFIEKHEHTSYEDAKDMIKDSHEKVMGIIARFSDAELFQKDYFPWTGGTTLGQYAISTTSAHYDWASKKCRAHLKTFK